MTEITPETVGGLPRFRVDARIVFRDEREDLALHVYAPDEDTAQIVVGRVGLSWGEKDDVTVYWRISEMNWERESLRETQSGQYGWVQELAPAGMVQALPVIQHGDPELPEGVAPGEISWENFPLVIRALNLIRADSGGPSWPPQSKVIVPERWVSYMSRIEQGLGTLREDAPPPEDPEACERWKTEESFLDSEFYAFAVPSDEVGDQMALRSEDLWLAAQFLADFFDGWSQWEDEGFDSKIREMMP